MNIKGKMGGGMFLLIWIFLISFAAAEFTLSNPQLSLPFSSENTGFDTSLCTGGEDFVLQINPLKCSPTVVTSDLLEEQDVQVYCEVSATQLNPLIDVSSIGNIEFIGELPPEVSGIAFYPARAALSTSQDFTSPIFNNVGYVVINIKQQPNESQMPDYVAGNLTAEIKYDIENSFGVGNAKFYLPEMSPENWDENYGFYDFWDGKGYLKAEDINDGKATLSVYNKNLRRVSSVNLNEGETSPDISIPGFDYCQGSLNLKLEDLENPDTRVQIKINSDIVEVAKGGKFLDNKCQVNEISKEGLNQRVVIKCQGDKSFELTISPKITLSINDVEKDFSVGQKLFDYKDKVVYLGYVGSDDSGSQDNLFIYLVAMPDKGEMLSDDVLKGIASNARALNSNVDTTTVGILDGTVDAVKKVGNWLVLRAVRWTGKGQTFARLKYGTGTENIFDNSIQLIDFAGSSDVELSGKSIQYYHNALDDYDRILDSYSQEKYKTLGLGEEALYEKIQLAYYLGQKTTMADFCGEFKEKYPDSDKNLENCDDKYKLSNSKFSARYVTINGNEKRLSLEGIYEPDFDNFGAVVQVKYPDGHIIPFDLYKDDIAYINESENEYLLIDSLNDGSAKIRINLKKSQLKDALTSEMKTLEKDIPLTFEDYVFTLKEINLNKVAKVSVIANINNKGTEAKFGFKVGIEKRNIQLAPEQIKSQIELLNKSISTFEGISDVLDKTVEVGNAACLATSTVLTAYNLIANAQGKGIARTYVMQGDGGWYKKCRELEPNNIDGCLLEHNMEIENEVNDYYEILQQQNEQIKNLQNQVDSSKQFGETVINTDQFLEKYCLQVSNTLGSVFGNDFNNPADSSETIDISDIQTALTKGWNNGLCDTENSKEIEFYLKVLKDNPNDERAEKRLYFLLSDVETNSGNFVERDNFATKTGMGESSLVGSSLELEEIPVTEQKQFGGTIYSNYPLLPAENPESSSITPSIGNSDYVFSFKDKGSLKEYLIVYDEDGAVLKTFEIIGNSLLLTNERNPLDFSFKKYDASSYKNKFDNPEIRYYETQPYKGFPAIVPFDLDNGWYAATQQILPVGNNIRSYEDSGRVSSFYLCNVGADRNADFFSGINDDECVGIDVAKRQVYDQFPYLSETEAASLAGKAVDALYEASRKYSAGIREVTINGQRIPVGNPAVDLPGLQCQDFMSAQQCAIIFNVCDPFVCPSSRCDFGGKYPVQDVVQTGIAGSVALCLPNFVGFGGDVVVPICVTGVKAGVDNFLSVQNAYKDCLTESLETGKNTGICDEMNSVYMCEFFWRQAAPLADVAVQNAASLILKQNTKGGGEYLGFKDAWENAQDSVNYFTQSYGDSAFSVFKARSTQEVGTVFCKNFISAVVPSSVDIISSLTAADSPAQFSGRFDEIPFSSVTVPPTSHYKVFYHIYAGENEGAYYSVYLKSGTESSFYQDTSNTRLVDSGYIVAGDYASDTKDFTAPLGYKQLCINVNGQEECDFKEVSTSFAVNYVQDEYASYLINNTNINSEEECVSGDFFGLDPTVVSPKVYERGITRICATSNPGLGSDPYVETGDSRWIQVGNCGNQNLKCWLDKKSVENVIDFTNIENDTLQSVSENYLDILISEGNYLTEQDFEGNVSNAKDKEPEERVNIFTEILKKVFYNKQKGYTHLLRGDAFAELARRAFNLLNDDETTTTDNQQVGKTYTINHIGFRIDGEEILDEDVSTFLGSDIELIVDASCDNMIYKGYSDAKGLASVWNWISSAGKSADDPIGETTSLEEINSILSDSSILVPGNYYVEVLCYKGDKVNEKKDSGILTILNAPAEICQQYLNIIDEEEKDWFDYYARKNLPNGWKVNDFKALLFAIAHRQSNLGLADPEERTDWIMEYGWINGERQSQYEGIEKQISGASNQLKKALEQNGLDDESDYLVCKENDVKCVVGVYLTGSKPRTGFFGIGKNPSDEFSDEVLKLWEIWKNYFNSAGSEGTCAKIS